MSTKMTSSSFPSTFWHSEQHILSQCRGALIWVCRTSPECQIQWMAAYFFKTLAARNIVRRNLRQFECHVRHGHWKNDTILSESFLSTPFLYQENCWTWTAKHHLIHMKIHYPTKCRQQNQNELVKKKLITYLSCWHVASLVLVIVACSWPMSPRFIRE